MENVVNHINSPNKKFWKNKKVFLTGHTGFKGSWLYLWLKLLNANVNGYSNNYSNYPSLFKYINGTKKNNGVGENINNYKNLKLKLDLFQPEIIFHFAAQPLVLKSYASPLSTHRTNILGTANLLEASKNLKNLKVICIVTSDKCYLNTSDKTFFKEDDKLGGSDPYSASKACAEILTKSYYDSFYKALNISVFSVRAGNVIGGGDWSKDRLIPDCIKGYYRNKKIEIRNPLSIRPWQFVLDPLNGYLRLAENAYKSKNIIYDGWNLGPMNKNHKSVEWILNELSKHFENFNKFISINPNVNNLESTYLQLTSNKIKKQINWNTKLSLKQSIEWTANWYKGYYSGKVNLCQNQIRKFEKI